MRAVWFFGGVMSGILIGGLADWADGAQQRAFAAQCETPGIRCLVQVTPTYLETHQGINVLPFATYGAVVCVAELVDCVPTRELRGVIPEEAEFWGDFSDGETGAGRFAFRLTHVHPLPHPLMVRGQQGFFDVQLQEFAEDGATLSLFGEGV